MSLAPQTSPGGNGADGGSGRTVLIRIKRRPAPGEPSRWEEFAVPHRPNLTVSSCLRWIAANPTCADGKPTTPPAWEGQCLEETCGACTILINGKVRPACSAMVDALADPESAITLEPMSKFPVVRDLIVDRGRLFTDLGRVLAWIPIDGSYDLGPGPGGTQAAQERRYPLSRCTHCCCCLEACPQYTPTNQFVGAAVINQARLMSDHPTGSSLKSQRLDVLMSEGGVQDCGKSGNCVEACPKDIPLLESIAAVQRQATLHAVKKLFTG